MEWRLNKVLKDLERRHDLSNEAWRRLGPNSSYSHPLQICDSNHTHSLMSSQWSQLLANDCPSEEEKNVIVRNGGPTRPEDCFLSRFMQRRREMAHPVPTEAYLQPSPEAAMLFAPFRCTHVPPPVPPFLLAQNLSLKDIATSDITSSKSAD